ncbi:hypothetical protein [Mucisphaera sp.]|uniref:hypothetical protein n=1 Tax=Mucisphaera sp. TaxID=2913024 RepID=UPI003D0D76F6
MADLQQTRASIWDSSLPGWFTWTVLGGLALMLFIPFLQAKQVADKSDELMHATSAHAYVCALAIHHIETTDTMPQSWSDLLAQTSSVEDTDLHAYWRERHDYLRELVEIDFALVGKAVDQESLFNFTQAMTLKVDEPELVPRDEADL